MALLTTQGKAGLAGAMVAVSAYLRAAPETLQALHRIANTQASAAMGSAVQSAAAYYRHLDDLLPDRFGVYGRLDDSWLCTTLPLTSWRQGWPRSTSCPQAGSRPLRPPGMLGTPP
jgi:hypothetical protein